MEILARKLGTERRGWDGEKRGEGGEGGCPLRCQKQIDATALTSACISARQGCLRRFLLICVQDVDNYVSGCDLELDLV